MIALCRKRTFVWALERALTLRLYPAARLTSVDCIDQCFRMTGQLGTDCAQLRLKYGDSPIRRRSGVLSRRERRTPEVNVIKVFELNPTAINRMIPVDLAKLNEEPPSPIGNFDFHGCICGIASYSGQPPWELHNGGDELLHILAGECDFTLVANGTKESRTLHAGDVALVPRGHWHRTRATNGVTLLFMTPREGSQHSWADNPPADVVD
jgi:mannose-6-phosphate isomerase-like protein (cupin superfamily)